MLDTNIYIFNYKYIRNLYSSHNRYLKTKIEAVGLIFKYLEENQIPIILPKIILNEIKKKMEDFNYFYSYDVVFGNLNIIIDNDENFEYINRPLAQRLFYDSSTDLMIYIYSKEKEIQIIITDNTKDFFECEEIYENNINQNNQNEIEVIIASIAEISKVINKQKQISNN